MQQISEYAQISLERFVGSDGRAASPMCVICSALSGGDLYCCRACAVEQQRRVFGAPLRDFAPNGWRYKVEAKAITLRGVMIRHGLIDARTYDDRTLAERLALFGQYPERGKAA